jgi:hypothetical protein
MRDLEKLWVTFRKTQCEFEILSLLVLCRPKPTRDGNALKGEMIGNERIDVRANVRTLAATFKLAPIIAAPMRSTQSPGRRPKAGAKYVATKMIVAAISSSAMFLQRIRIAAATPVRHRARLPPSAPSMARAAFREPGT